MSGGAAGGRGQEGRRAASGEGLVDPTDLDGLREALAASDSEGRLAPLGMRRIEVGPESLDLLPEAVSGLVGDGGGRVVLVTDPTPIPRGEAELKGLVEGTLAGRLEVERARRR